MAASLLSPGLLSEELAPLLRTLEAKLLLPLF